jgi:uncharacterized protein YjlB
VFRRALQGIYRRITALEVMAGIEGAMIVATQADVDALTAAVGDLESQVTADETELGTAVAGIQAEIDALKNANPALDLTGLQAKVTDAQSAVTDLGTAVSSVSALVPPATS